MEASVEDEELLLQLVMRQSLLQAPTLPSHHTCDDSDTDFRVAAVSEEGKPKEKDSSEYLFFSTTKSSVFTSTAERVAKDCGCEMRAGYTDDGTLVVIKGEKGAVNQAKAIMECMEEVWKDDRSVDTFLPLSHSQQKKLSIPHDGSLVHVFVDSSNVLIGAGGLIHVDNLVGLVEDGRQCHTRILVGSVKTAQHKEAKLWLRWQKLNYQVRLAVRGEGGENFVDDALHSAISRALLNPVVDGVRQTMVLLTGDGNDNHDGTGNNFPFLVQRALKEGWKVELWSWKKGTSNAFKKMFAEQKILLQYFDEHKESLLL